MKWLKTCLCCMTVILVGVASAVTRASARTVNEVPSPTQASCPGFCMICAVFELQYMVTPAGPGLPGNDEEATSMCGHHVPCSFECRMTLQSEIRSVEKAVASNSPHEIARLLSQSRYLEYNRDRRAMQILGCQPDQVVAHLPLLSDGLVHELETQVPSSGAGQQ